MTPHLLDTNVIVDVLRRRNDAHLLVERLLKQGQPLASCPITIAEVYAGMRPHEEKPTRAFMKSLVFLPVTAEAAEHAGYLKAQYAQRGRTLSLQDATIAAVSIAFHSVLSRGEFTIPLKIGVPVLCCGCLYLKNPRKLVKIGQFSVCNLSQNKGMTASTLTPKDVLAVCCPTCGAASGKPCELGGGGLRSTPHRDRELSAGDVVDCVSKKKNSS